MGTRLPVEFGFVVALIGQPVGERDEGTPFGQTLQGAECELLRGAGVEGYGEADGVVLGGLEAVAEPDEVGVSASWAVGGVELKETGGFPDVDEGPA